jgi:hypothetical protein
VYEEETGCSTVYEGKAREGMHRKGWVHEAGLTAAAFTHRSLTSALSDLGSVPLNSFHCSSRVLQGATHHDRR